MKLGSLLEGVAVTGPVAAGAGEIEALNLEYDSRRARPGSVFFAFPGAKTDGRRFAVDAIAKGAVAVVCESPAPEDASVPWIQVNHGREALARMSRTFYGKPDEALKLTGLTGTNGKTTTVYLIDEMLRSTGAITGMAGTIHYHVAGEERPAVNTTPESLDLMRLMAETRDRGGSYFNFEVSSHALDLRRVFGPVVPHGGLHEPDARPSGLSQDHGSLLRGQAAALRWRGRHSAAGRRDQRRRPERAQASHRGFDAPADLRHQVQCGSARRAHRERLQRRRFPDCLSGARDAPALAVVRPDQRLQPAGRLRRGASLWGSNPDKPRRDSAISPPCRDVSSGSTKGSRSWWWWTMPTPTTLCAT